MSSSIHLNLAKHYSRSTHLTSIPQLHSGLPDSLTKIYDPLWELDEEHGGIPAPYETITYLLDCYYCLPERPDLAALFGWQAINHCYSQFLLSDAAISNLSDNKGVGILIDKLCAHWPQYERYLRPYFSALPEKAWRYIASSLLRSYCAKEAGLNPKYIAKNYKAFLTTFPALDDMLTNSIGPALLRDCAKPAEIVNNRLVIHADTPRFLEIQRLLADKLMDLVKTGSTQYRHSGATIKIHFTDKEIITLVVQFLLYASRNSNLHGTVASRLNSNKANDRSYTLYTRLFLLEYMLLGIMLHMQGSLSDEALDRLLKNKLLIT